MIRVCLFIRTSYFKQELSACLRMLVLRDSHIVFNNWIHIASYVATLASCQSEISDIKILVFKDGPCRLDLETSHTLNLFKTSPYCYVLCILKPFSACFIQIDCYYNVNLLSNIIMISWFYWATKEQLLIIHCFCKISYSW